MKQLIKFIIEDFKKDIETIKAMLKGEAKLRFKVQDLFKWDKSFWQENWLMFLLIILAFLVGYMVGGNVAMVKCEQFIYNFTHQVPDFVNLTALTFS